MLSIITVVKNDLEGLINTHKSLFGSPFEMEWIVIDGGSDTATLAFSKCVTISHFTYLRELDSNLYEAMNKGIELSRGNHLLFLNAGDELFEGQDLSGLLDLLPSDHGLIASISRFDEMRKQEQIVRPHLLTRFCVKFGLAPASHQGVIYPRCFFTDQKYEVSVGLHADQISILLLLSTHKVERRRELILSRFRNGGIGDQQNHGAFFLQMLRYRIQQPGNAAKILELLRLPLILSVKTCHFFLNFTKRHLP